jgi:hypothetical protein
MLASSLAVPELALNETEAKQLAQAVVNVANYYPVAIDPKTQAWGALFMVAGSLYGSRAVAFYARQSSENKASATAQPAPAMNGHLRPVS